MRRMLMPLTFTLLAASCASFENVKATAKLGTALGDDPIVINDWVADCESVHASKDDQDLEKICRSHTTNYRGMVTVVHDVSGLLQDYAAALAAAADDKDIDVGDDLTAIAKQMGALDVDSVKKIPAVYNIAEVVNTDKALVGKLTPTGIVKVVDTIVKFASQSYRRKAIATAVVEADPDIDILTAFLSAEIELHLADVRDLRQALDNEVSARPIVSTTPVVAELLPLVAASLDDRISSLKRLDVACQSFRRAHHELAVRIQQDGAWQNDELMSAIKKDVEDVVKAVNGQ